MKGILYKSIFSVNFFDNNRMLVLVRFLLKVMCKVICNHVFNGASLGSLCGINKTFSFSNDMAYFI